jgi:hypothetical protein
MFLGMLGSPAGKVVAVQLGDCHGFTASFLVLLKHGRDLGRTLNGCGAWSLQLGQSLLKIKWECAAHSQFFAAKRHKKWREKL